MQAESYASPGLRPPTSCRPDSCARRASRARRARSSTRGKAPRLRRQDRSGQGSATATRSSSPTGRKPVWPCRDSRPARPALPPGRGRRVRAPPLLRWQADAGATFYNVQLYRNGVKVLSSLAAHGEAPARPDVAVRRETRNGSSRAATSGTSGARGARASARGTARPRLEHVQDQGVAGRGTAWQLGPDRHCGGCASRSGYWLVARASHLPSGRRAGRAPLRSASRSPAPQARTAGSRATSRSTGRDRARRDLVDTIGCAPPS